MKLNQCTVLTVIIARWVSERPSSSQQFLLGCACLNCHCIVALNSSPGPDAHIASIILLMPDYDASECGRLRRIDILC